MKIKDRVLLILQENRDEFISGENIAKELNCSRTAIWKAINSLKDEDYSIDSVSNKGYCLKENIALNIDKIKDEISKEGIKGEIYNEISSTNTRAKEIIIGSNCSSGDFVIAKKQTLGKAKGGNSFNSPKEVGIYLSVIIKPEASINCSTIIMANIATEIVSILREELKREINIKWLNEFVYENNKVGGVLTEAITDFETGNIQYAIVGIGLYLLSGKENNGIFKSKRDLSKIDVNKVIGKIINGIIKVAEKKTLNNCYKEYNYLLNNIISIKQDKELYKGIFSHIDSKGRLVLDIDGKKKIFNTGEII